MALLVFDESKLSAPLAAILDPQLRVNIATKVNEAILRAYGESPGARLVELLKTRLWAENEARRLNKPLPEKIDIGLDPPEGAKPAGDGNTQALRGEDAQMAD